MNKENKENKESGKLENFYTGCIAGSKIGRALGTRGEGLSRQEISQKLGRITGISPGLETTPSTQEILFSSIIPLALGGIPGPERRERFKEEGVAETSLPGETWIDRQCREVAIAGIQLLAEHAILPEDLMSATLDLLPFGFNENPVREKLLASQDYLEERQTLVDNIEAGNLEVDLFLVDLKNMERCGTNGILPEVVARAFYAVTARKNSFEEAVLLGVNAGGKAKMVGELTGALAGAYHGLDLIPGRWKNNFPELGKSLEIARELILKQKPV